MKFPERKGQKPADWIGEHQGEKFKRPKGTVVYEIVGIEFKVFGIKVNVRTNRGTLTQVGWRDLRRMEPVIDLVPTFPRFEWTATYKSVSAPPRNLDLVDDVLRNVFPEYQYQPIQPAQPAKGETIMANLPMALRNSMPDPIGLKMEQLARFSAREAIDELMKRHAESGGFTSDSAAYLAGLAMVPDCREQLDDEIDNHLALGSLDRVQKLERKRTAISEVVIGSGIHAAIYCAVRRAMGHPRPIVIEQADRIGGAFAMTKGPAFYLNSRNRPGKLTIPGDSGGGLNVIPEAPIQPCDLSASEYQRNSDVAFAVRMTLLMHSKPVVMRQVVSVQASTSTLEGIRYFVNLNTGTTIPTNRIILASGMGEPTDGLLANNKTILTYEQFMQRLDTAFPFKGMRKVAVIGMGDSGKTVVEALVGQGPGAGWSTAALDWIDKIDWWQDEIPASGQEWEQCSRSRYRGLARFFPDDRTPKGSAKITPIAASAAGVSDGYNCAYINSVPYDCVVMCKGFTQRPSILSGFRSPSYMTRGDRNVGLRHGAESTGLFTVGPAAMIPLTSTEVARYGQVAENGTAIFRLADRTAMVAATT